MKLQSCVNSWFYCSSCFMGHVWAPLTIYELSLGKVASKHYYAAEILPKIMPWSYELNWKDVYSHVLQWWIDNVWLLCVWALLIAMHETHSYGLWSVTPQVGSMNWKSGGPLWWKGKAISRLWRACHPILVMEGLPSNKHFEVPRLSTQCQIPPLEVKDSIQGLGLTKWLCSLWVAVSSSHMGKQNSPYICGSG